MRCTFCAPSTIHTMRCIARKFIICYLARIIIVFLCTCEIRIRVCNPTVGRRPSASRHSVQHTPSASDCNGNIRNRESISIFICSLASRPSHSTRLRTHFICRLFTFVAFSYMFLFLSSHLSLAHCYSSDRQIFVKQPFFLSLSLSLLLAFPFVYLLRIYILTNNTIIRCPSCACENQFSKTFNNKIV